jgi:thiamine biosynthesis protein ThiS
MIALTVNGERRELEGPIGLIAFLKSLAIDPRYVAVARNGDVVPREEWPKTTLQDGDVLEVVRMVGGGAQVRTRKEPLAVDTLLLLLAFGAGIAAATQILVNGALGEKRGVPEALLVSVTVTFGSAVLFMLIRFFVMGDLNLDTPVKPLLYLLPLAFIALLAFLGLAGGLQWYYFLGGLAGALIVGTVALTGPRIGIATTSAAVIAGQMVGAILFDHLGLLDQAKDPIDALKVTGALLIVGGVVLVRGF